MNKECDSNEKEKKQEKLVAAEAAHCFGKHANEKFPENALAVDSNSRNESESKPCEEKMLVCSGVDTDLNCESQTDCNKTTEEDIHTSDDFKVIEANSKTALSSPRIDIFESFSDQEEDEKMINKRESPENEGLATDEIANGSKIADDSMVLESLSDVESPTKDESAVEDSSACEGKKRKSEEGGSDSDDDEYMDAQGDAGRSRSRASKKLRSFFADSSFSSDNDSLPSSSDSSSDNSSNADSEKERKDRIEEENWLRKDIEALPDPVWRATCALKRRESLQSSRFWPVKVCGSYAMVKRFQLQSELDKHRGCVNALHFNQTGSLIASGSDDLRVMLWDWVNNPKQPAVSYESGHKSNVFQAKFLPNCNDATVVSSARDGQVRVADISSTGSCRNTKKIAQHRGSAHKLALDADSKSTFLSCGEDGVVFGIDLRCDKPSEKLVTVKVNNKKIPLYSIHSHPLRPYEFAVSGRVENALIYDRRMLRGVDSSEPVKLYCPHHLDGVQDTKANITCLVYNWSGSELLCSYNDEDIYLFDTSHSSGADYIRRYKGHRNNATVKGVNFYGPSSEFVVSGSDCGNIFFWEKKSSRIVALVEGDKGGVVNVLEPHPDLPIIATSGLDHQVKIWTPHGDPNDEGKLSQLKSLMLTNLREREEERRSMPEMIDGHMLWFLMRTLRSRHRMRFGEDNDSSSDDDLGSSDNSSNSSDESDRMSRCVQS